MSEVRHKHTSLPGREIDTTANPQREDKRSSLSIDIEPNPQSEVAGVRQAIKDVQGLEARYSLKLLETEPEQGPTEAIVYARQVLATPSISGRFSSDAIAIASGERPPSMELGNNLEEINEQRRRLDKTLRLSEALDEQARDVLNRATELVRDPEPEWLSTIEFFSERNDTHAAGIATQELAKHYADSDQPEKQLLALENSVDYLNRASNEDISQLEWLEISHQRYSAVFRASELWANKEPDSKEESRRLIKVMNELMRGPSVDVLYRFEYEDSFLPLVKDLSDNCGEHAPRWRERRYYRKIHKEVTRVIARYQELHRSGMVIGGPDTNLEERMGWIQVIRLT